MSRFVIVWLALCGLVAATACSTYEGEPTPAASPQPSPTPESTPPTTSTPALTPTPSPTPIDDGLYDFTVERDFLEMPDGVRLAVTWYRPEPVLSDETFPVLLEMRPYRQDDEDYIRDYSLATFFAQRGYAYAKVDVRGTGRSEGEMVWREYSEEELSDLEVCIDLVAHQPWSTGAVGLIGKSWSAFNALMIAVRNPPALKALVVLHGSDELFYDDVHYVDGIFHVDDYEVQMESDNILPAAPDYALDDDYFTQRFSAKPWFVTYKEQQRDGDFWQEPALRYQYDQLTLPVYFIGGLLDGYRDTGLRLLEQSNGPVRVEMGPWNHAYPDDGYPAPNYEWRTTAIRWYDRYLKGIENGIDADPRLMVFVREGDAPDKYAYESTGQFRYEDWPIARTTWTSFYPDAGQGLASSAGEAGTDNLPYRAGFGMETGDWWGETTPDMSEADRGALVYDSSLVQEPIEIVGFPKVSLRVSAEGSQANWVVRLEDVFPDGSVALVTGGALNGAQRNSRTSPEALEPGAVYDLELPLHFTTWTFQPGHRIRLAVTNAQFAMFWPTAGLSSTNLFRGGDFTRIELPVIPFEDRPIPTLDDPIASLQPPDAYYVDGGGYPLYDVAMRDDVNGRASVNRMYELYTVVGDLYLYDLDELYYEVEDADPEHAFFEGRSENGLWIDDRFVLIQAFMSLEASPTDFRVQLTRRAYENERLLFEKSWDELIPRDFQ